MSAILKEIEKNGYTWRIEEEKNIVKEAAVAYKVTLEVPPHKETPYVIPGLESGDILDRIDAIKQGIPAFIVETLCRDLDLSRRDLAKYAGIPERTLIRKIQEGRLTPNQSERMMRVARVFSRGVEVLGSKERAVKWFKASRAQLHNQTPLEFMDTELGATEVANLLGRIEYGVFS